MLIAIITDTHYNFKKGNKVFHDYFEKFYNNIFLESGIKHNFKIKCGTTEFYSGYLQNFTSLVTPNNLVKHQAEFIFFSTGSGNLTGSAGSGIYPISNTTKDTFYPDASNTIIRFNDGLNELNNNRTVFQPQFVIQNTMQGQEVDDAIMAERERDIKKMNQDLLLVNEMFRDMAQIVNKQGGQIEEIEKTTESSHERAKAGLEQVRQAANHQSSCVIC